MKKSLLAVLALLLLCGGVFTGCTNSPTSTASSSTSTLTSTSASTTTTAEPDDGFTTAWCQATLKALKDIQPAQVPDNLADTGAKTGGEFDVNDYFNIWTHLSMESGYALDYVYLTDTKNGGPILYVRKTGAIPFYSYQEYSTATHETPRQDTDQSLIWLIKGTKDTAEGNNIRIDGTRQGYFEYSMLQAISNRFYLLGGAIANNKHVVVDKADLEALWPEIEADSKLTITDEYKEKAQILDFTPSITVFPDVVKVSFVMCGYAGGFTRYTYYVSTSSPHFITYVLDDALLNAPGAS